MSRGVIQPSQQKLAEKLTILNDRGIGMLTRVYNIKKVGAHTHTVAIFVRKSCSQTGTLFLVNPEFPSVWWSDRMQANEHFLNHWLKHSEIVFFPPADICFPPNTDLCDTSPHSWHISSQHPRPRLSLAELAPTLACGKLVPRFGHENAGVRTNIHPCCKRMGNIKASEHPLSKKADDWVNPSRLRRC